MLEKYEVCVGLFHGFDWSLWVNGSPGDRLSLLPAAQEHILGQEDGKTRLLRAVTELSQAFALSVPHLEALRIRDDVGFFQAVRSVLAKGTTGGGKTDEDLDRAVGTLLRAEELEPLLREPCGGGRRVFDRHGEVPFPRRRVRLRVLADQVQFLRGADLEPCTLEPEVGPRHRLEH